MELSIEYVDPISLKPNRENAKIHTDKQVDKIAKSMTNTGGSIQPIVVDEDGVILAGHGRWMAHKKLGDISVPIVRKTGLSSAQKRKFLLADNQTNAMTGNEFEAVSKILEELNSEGVDISDIGFSEKDIDSYLNYTEEEEDRDALEEAGTESEGMTQLKEDINIPLDACVGEWQLPQLIEHGIPEIGTETEFVVWMNRHRTPALGANQMHYHLFGRESTKGLDPQQTVMSFYIDDVRFERIWTKLRENTQRFLNANLWAVVQPDFTRVDGWPLSKNLWNVYRGFHVALYWQKAGLMVIPNLCDWNLDSVEACCAPIPERAPVISTQLQTLGGRTMKSGEGGKGFDADTHRACLGASLDLLKPESLIVYGGGPGLTLGEEICKRHSVRFIGVPNRATAATDINSERGF